MLDVREGWMFAKVRCENIHEQISVHERIINYYTPSLYDSFSSRLHAHKKSTNQQLNINNTAIMAILSILGNALTGRRSRSTQVKSRKSQSLEEEQVVKSEGGVFLSVHTMPTDYDSSSSTHSNSVTSSPTSSPSTSWKSTGGKSFLQRSPLVVNDPESGDEPIKDEVEALGLLMARSRHLPGTWYYSSNHVMVNQERTKRTIAPLFRMRELDEIARQHVDAMAREDRAFHSDPSFLRMQFNRPARRLGENVAKGPSIRAIHKAMMATRSDYNNIADRRYTHMGMATAKASDGELFMCQIFRG
jgi:hypothetical protein